MPDWFLILTTTFAAIFTAAQGVAAVAQWRQTQTAQRREREDAEARRRESKQQELFTALARALAIHRESTDPVILEESFKDRRESPEARHLLETHKRLQLAQRLLEEQGILPAQGTSHTIEQSVANLISDGLRALEEPINRDARDGLTTDSLVEFQQRAAEPFDVGRVKRLLLRGSLSVSDDEVFSSHIEVAYLFGARLSAHSGNRLEVEPGKVELFFMIADWFLSRENAADSAALDRGIVYLGDYSEDPAVARERFEEQAAHDEELRRYEEQQARMTKEDWLEEQDAEAALPQEYWQELAEEQGFDRDDYQAEQEAWQASREEFMQKRFLVFGKYMEMDRTREVLGYRFLGVFQATGYVDGDVLQREEMFRIADEVRFDGRNYKGCNEELYDAEHQRRRPNSVGL